MEVLKCNKKKIRENGFWENTLEFKEIVSQGLYFVKFKIVKLCFMIPIN